MPYDLYPAVDPTYNFPPEVRLALSKSTELRNTVIPMTTTARNNLAGVELWDGRVIANTTTDHLERYDLGTTKWWPIGNDNVFATEAARNTAIPNPTVGMKSYITALNQEQIYGFAPTIAGAAAFGWIPCGGSVPYAFALYTSPGGINPTGNGPMGRVPDVHGLSGGLTWSNVTGMYTVPYSGLYSVEYSSSRMLNNSATDWSTAAIGNDQGGLIMGGDTFAPVVNSADTSLSTVLGFWKGEKFGPYYYSNCPSQEIFAQMTVTWVAGTTNATSLRDTNANRRRF